MVDTLERWGTPKKDWLHAVRSLRRLLENKEDTRQVFEIMRTLNGKATARNYLRLLETVDGGRLAFERQELSHRLMDDAFLDALPEGSVGAAYRDFVRSENLSAHGLVRISREGVKTIDDPHPYAWFGRRVRDVHDIWHVLTGYGRDSLGEGSLVWFSYAQTRGKGWALIGLGAIWRATQHKGHPYVRSLIEGYRRGRRAAWLLGEDYERLLREPLDVARRRLNITPGAIYDSIPVTARDRAVQKPA